MKIKDGFVKQKLGDKTILVSAGKLSREFHGMIELNSTAEEIWDGVADGLSRDEIALKLSQKYGISTDKARRDTDRIIDKMISSGVMQSD